MSDHEETKEDSLGQKRKDRSNTEETLQKKNKSSESSLEDLLLQKFSYRFNSELRLESTETGKKFEFTCQSDYEALGKAVQKVIQYRMEQNFNLIRTPIPNSSESHKSYIYISKNVLSCSKEKVLLLIQGAGSVRPGLWSRSVCINDSLSTGSMIPFLKYAQENDLEVIIFNPNKTYSKNRPVPENSTREDHSKYVWSRFVRPFSEVYIVAHSCGGISTMALISNFWEEVREKVKGIAFTDTVHGYYGMSKEKLEFLKERAVDWVASSKPLDTLIRESPIVHVSSGHFKHEYTTGSCQYSIMKFLSEIKHKNSYLDKVNEDI